MAANKIITDDCLEVMREMPDDFVDMVFCSPPYEDARTYGIDFKLKGQDWVDWAVERYMECVRVSKGLVAWVVEGKTRGFKWSATPALMMADLHRKGVKLRKPAAFHRHGIPGSGGPDWLRNDYEFIVCSSKGKLPWSDNTSMGSPPKYPPGGAPSHRSRNGERVNVNSKKALREGVEPKVQAALKGEIVGKIHTKHNGKEMRVQCYAAPKKANPGNVVKCSVGGGRMGSPLAHENEAPFPESLVEFFVRSFCKPRGVVLDPFSGSGTTAAVAVKLDRKFIAIDSRECQADLTERRASEVAKLYKVA